MDIFKWTIFVEFIVALYSFNIFAELIILPIIAFLSISPHNSFFKYNEGVLRYR